MDLRAGQTVAGRFCLERELGRGGMGAVWRARHVTLDMPCAVKFIRGDDAERDDLRDRFQREAQAAAKLRSPHVVQMLDFGVWEDHPYIAMELLVGETLGAKLQREKVLSARETIAIAHDVAAALTKAATLGIVHRDLKPDNIFLVTEGTRELAKVLDFGIAKTSASVCRLTKTGALLGTPHYMSPEQAHGGKQLDSRADLWSLAVVVFQCLTGRCPFEGEALGELIWQIMSGELPTPSEVRPGLPRAFDLWWHRAAARNPADRFQSAAMMARELESALLSRSESIPTAVDGTRLTAAALSHGDTDPAPAGAVAQSGTLVSVELAPPLPQLSNAGAAPRILEPSTFEGQAAPSTRHASRTAPWVWPCAGAAAVVVAVGLGVWRLDVPAEANHAAIGPSAEATPNVRPRAGAEPSAPEAREEPTAQGATEGSATPNASASASPRAAAPPPATAHARRRLPTPRTAPRPTPPPASPPPAPAPTNDPARLSDPGY